MAFAWSDREREPIFPIKTITYTIEFKQYFKCCKRCKIEFYDGCEQCVLLFCSSSGRRSKNENVNSEKWVSENLIITYMIAVNFQTASPPSKRQQQDNVVIKLGLGMHTSHSYMGNT